MNSGSVFRYGAQGLFYVVFVVVVGYFATAPSHTYVALDQARVTMTFAHYGEREGECRTLTEEEKAELPPNMRVEEDCPRGRVPITVELWLDDELYFSDRISPTGLHGDGRAYVYEAFRVPAGEHRLVMKLRDRPDTDEFNYVKEADITIGGGQSLVIDFSPQAGGFVLRNLDA